MGDRYFISVVCPECDLMSYGVYYAPTCDITEYKCDCGYIIDLEEYTGITAEMVSNKILIEELIEEIENEA